MLGGLVLAVAILGIFGSSNSRRLAQVRRRFPSASVAPLVVAPFLAESLAAATDSLNLPRSRVRETSYVTIAADRERVRFFSRGGRGEPAAEIPSSWVRSVEFGDAVVGARRMRSIDLKVPTSRGVVTLPLIPMRSRGNWLRKVPDAQLDDLAVDLQRSIGVPAN